MALIWRTAIYLVAALVIFCSCCAKCQHLKRHEISMPKVDAKLLSYLNGGEIDNAVGLQRQEKNYSKSFAYGCLWQIPIPNTTLDTTFTPEQEKVVLMELFNQTDGHKWKNNTFWRNDSVSHCLWYGVTCDNSSQSYVISLSLVENKLRGTLPRNLWKLRNLQGLCIYGNSRLSGNIGEVLSANMTALLRLDLAFNRLSGVIPGEILSKMKSLVKIQLCCQLGEGISGGIPKDVGDLTELQVLSLGQNQLNGLIPESIGRLRKLWFLDLETANFSGGLENLFNLSSLRYMHLSLAGLHGTLPDDFGLFFPAMKQCLLSGNHFTGNVPSTIGNITNLQHLDLAKNNFFGEIPKSIGTIPGLQIADFRENRFTSLQTGTKFVSKSLEVLLLGGNHKFTLNFNNLLEALEPVSFSLRILDVSDCNMFGRISTKLWDFTNLIEVDLKNNSLYGELSKPTDNFFMVLYLDVSANNLSGEIPSQIARLQMLQTLDVSRNILMHEFVGDGKILPQFMRVDFNTLTRRNPSDKFKCPNARLNYNDGLVVLDPRYYSYRLCICDMGYYGSGKDCLPCMKGASCHDQTRHDNRRMIMNAGYWPSSQGDGNVTHLVDCAKKLGVGSRENTPCNPSGTCDCGNIVTETGPVTVCDKSCLCRKGHKDRFCSRCKDGYYKQGILCHSCRSTSGSSVYILAALVAALVLLTVVFFLYKRRRLLSIFIAVAQIIILFVFTLIQIIPGWFLELNTVYLIVGLAGRGKASRGILKISVFYFQTLDALILNIYIWPEEVLQAQRYLSAVFNLQFSSFACAFPRLFTPLGKMLFLILLPIIFILCVWLYFTLGYLLPRLWNPLERFFPSRNSCLQLCIVSLNLTYFPIVKTTASVLAHCDEDNGFRYLREVPWQECRGQTYTILQGIGWLALFFYGCGVPLGVFLPLLILYVRRREELCQEEQNNLDSWLGSIYLPYKRDFHSYFEILYLVRRMLIAFSLSLIPRASPYQTIVTCSVLVACIGFQLFYRPFKDSYQKVPLENTAEILVLLTLHFSFMNSRYALLNKTASGSIVGMLITVNLMVLFFIVLSMIMLLVKGVTASPTMEPTQNASGGENAGLVEDGSESQPND